MGFSKKKKAYAVRYTKYKGLPQIICCVLFTIWYVSLEKGMKKSVYYVVKRSLKR